MKKLDEDVLSALREVDWTDITAKILLLTKREMFRRRISWLYPLSWKGPEDYVNEAVTLFLDGKRIWKPKEVSFLLFLRGTISSVISHDVKKAIEDIKKSVSFDSEPAAQDELHIKINPEEEIANEELLTQLERSLNNDVDIKIVRLIITSGEVKPRELAKGLGVSVSEIYNARKRLQRALLVIIMKNGPALADKL